MYISCYSQVVIFQPPVQSSSFEEHTSNGSSMPVEITLESDDDKKVDLLHQEDISGAFEHNEQVSEA